MYVDIDGSEWRVMGAGRGLDVGLMAQLVQLARLACWPWGGLCKNTNLRPQIRGHPASKTPEIELT